MAGKATDAPALSGLLFQWRNGGRWLQHQQRIEAELGRAAGGTIPAACQKLVAHLCDPLADATIPTALGLRRSPLATGEHGSVMRMMLRSPSPAARAYAAGLLVGSAEATAEDKAAIKALKRDQAIVMVGIHDLRAEVTIEKYLSDIEAW